LNFITGVVRKYRILKELISNKFTQTTKANAPCTQHILTCTQHNFKNSKNALYSRNKNPELKIIYSGKIYPEVVIEFQK